MEQTLSWRELILLAPFGLFVYAILFFGGYYSSLATDIRQGRAETAGLVLVAVYHAPLLIILGLFGWKALAG